MLNPRSLTFVSLIAAAGLAFAACGGGANGDKTPAGDVIADGDTSQEPVAPAPADTEEVRAKATKFSRATFKATYVITGPQTGGVNGSMLTLYKDGDKKFRFDITGTEDGKDVAIISIEAPGVSALCLKNAGDFGALFGIEGDEGVCLKSDPQESGDAGGGLETVLKGLENADVTVLEKSTRTAAGLTGTCYRAQDNGTSQINTTCYTDDGLIIYREDEGDEPSVMEAQTISRTVSADDFNLPYDVKDLPGLDGSQ
jgi:hypothetical protein